MSADELLHTQPWGMLTRNTSSGLHETQSSLCMHSLSGFMLFSKLFLAAGQKAVACCGGPCDHPVLSATVQATPLDEAQAKVFACQEKRSEHAGTLFATVRTEVKSDAEGVPPARVRSCEGQPGS